MQRPVQQELMHLKAAFAKPDQHMRDLDLRWHFEACGCGVVDFFGSGLKKSRAGFCRLALAALNDFKHRFEVPTVPDEVEHWLLGLRQGESRCVV